MNGVDGRYHRNRIYIDKHEQETIKNSSILFGGSGLGSVIAECALRFGFEHITIVDGDQVELSNLNRQNYTEKDISTNKVQALKSRLQAINPDAVINIHNYFITEDNIEDLIRGHNIAINALDFTSDIPLHFDRIARKHTIPVLHPFNLGWAGLVAVVTPESMPLSAIARTNKKFNEIDVVEYVSGHLKSCGKHPKWINEVVEKFKNEEGTLPPPQLSIASWTVAAMCTHILYNLATGKQVKQFPKFYYSTILDT